MRQRSRQQLQRISGKPQQKPATNQPMEKERLRTITLLVTKKIVIRKKRTITTKNENYESVEIITK